MFNVKFVETYAIKAEIYAVIFQLLEKYNIKELFMLISIFEKLQEKEEAQSTS